MKKTLAIVLAAGMLMAVPALAREAAPETANVSAPRVITTTDGVLSMQLPDDNWKVTEDSQAWFVVTNGNDTITIDHLSNGEALPNPVVADNTYGGVFEAYISNNNEVFVVKGLASDRSDLSTLIQAAGTINILKADTKTAVQKETKPQVSDFGVRKIDATYYCVVDDLNVRTGCSANDPAIGKLNKGDEVHVIGMVTKNGEDCGWYQISFNGTQAYVSASFLAATKPEDSKSLVYCEYCGEWYEEGNIFRNHVCPNRDYAMGVENGAIELPAESGDHAGEAYCEYCGQWYEEGNVFRNHICPERDAANGEGDDPNVDYGVEVNDYEN